DCQALIDQLQEQIKTAPQAVACQCPPGACQCHHHHAS
ncbi:MAG: CopY/TcrY family copper transport repressor, partial [Abiotrophia sp.]|nr:CopY/TcrY family copper transport repressor [Abiotrophia sp.]